ncbi:MAG: glycosyltransferase [Flavipsychrobacter sp.]
MRVALIGNMNNNYFSLMRYLRDAGVDAELLLFADEINHFLPENDTWDIEKWKPYIKQTKINGGALGQYFKMSPADIRKEFEGYDYYIGCGFTPAYFYKAGMKLDLFTPYCVGIEYTYRITKTKPVHYLKEKVEAYYQVKGLKHNTKVVGTIDEESRIKSEKIGVKTQSLPLLMIYNKEQVKGDDEFLSTTIQKFNQHYPVVFSHVSHFPKGSKTWEIKRNDILIKGFADFANQTDANPLLVLFSYGEAVEASKAQIAQLGIEDKVMWLPVMSRKKIMRLLEHVHFGGGEFGGAVWGGTGWEFMAKGVPFFQYVDMPDSLFEANTGMKMPPFFNTNNSAEISRLLQTYISDKAKLTANGQALKAWFDKEAGQELANSYINILKS